MTQQSIVKGDTFQKMSSAGFILGAILVGVGGLIMPHVNTPTSDLQEMLTPLGEHEFITQLSSLLMAIGFWAVMALLEGKKEVEKISRQDHHVDIELANGADGASLLAELIQHGVLIDQVQQGKANLEEVFLSLMTEEQQQVVAG